MGRVWLLFVGSFLLFLTKFLFLHGDWALGYRSMSFRYFSNSLKSFGNLHIPCLLVIIAHRFTSGEEKIW